MLATVEEIDYESDAEPYEEPFPVVGGHSCKQITAGNKSEHRNERKVFHKGQYGHHRTNDEETDHWNILRCIIAGE